MNGHSDTQETAGAPTPASPPPPGHSRRLYRRTDRKMIAGVAAGLADYFDIDPTLVRIGFVLLAFLGGAGVVAYGVAWLLVPPSHEVASPGENVVRRLKASPSWVALALVAVGIVLLANATGAVSAPVGWGITLVVIGVLLFRHASREPEPGPAFSYPPPFPSPETPGLSAPPPPAAVTTTAPAPPAPPGPPGPPPPPEPPARPEVRTPLWIPPSPRRRRAPRDRGLFWGTVGVTLLAVGVAALLGNAGVIDIGVGAYLALALAVLGVGLLVGTWWGRSRGLIVLSILLTPFVLLASLVNVPIRGGVGDRFFGPRVVTDVRPVYRQIAGRMVLDLSRLRLGPSPVHVDASMVAGYIEVVLPRGVNASVHAEAGAGELAVLGNDSNGLNVDARRTTGPAAGGRLELDLAVSFGRILVYRSSVGLARPAAKGG
ncbi:MAG: PspC domain-containing protein [Actinomycetota bacterium]|nr:PspC domain-containing protein [Actinomycetota bacterium]